MWKLDALMCISDYTGSLNNLNYDNVEEFKNCNKKYSSCMVGDKLNMHIFPPF